MVKKSFLRNKNRKSELPEAVLIICILLVGFLAFAEEPNPYLKYFPANEKITSIATNDPDNPLAGYPKVLDEVVCPIANALLFNSLIDCENCLGYNTKCPACCVDMTSGSPQAQCAGFNCGQYAFSSGTCNEVDCCSPSLTDPDDVCVHDPLSTNCNPGQINNIPSCQRKGCPDATPDLTPQSPDCVPDSLGGSGWYCLENDLMPVDNITVRGCRPEIDIPDSMGTPVLTNYTPSTASQDIYYDLGPALTPCPEDSALGVSNTTPCYKYDIDPVYGSYINACRTYTDTAEICSKHEYCCKHESCGTGPTGTIADCDYAQPNPLIPGDEGGACIKLFTHWNDPVVLADAVTAKTCNTIIADDCLQIEQTIQDCVYDKSIGGCAQCFHEIDPPIIDPLNPHPGFRLDFVARSGQSMIIEWQLDTISNIKNFPAINDVYFFTMIKIYQEGLADPVFESIIHQKSLTADFSIFNAAAIEAFDPMTGLGVLHQGKKYSARIHYYIPEVNGADLEVTVKSMLLTAVMVRE